jgi:hypothetical protein
MKPSKKRNFAAFDSDKKGFTPALHKGSHKKRKVGLNLDKGLALKENVHSEPLKQIALKRNQSVNVSKVRFELDHLQP